MVMISHNNDNDTVNQTITAALTVVAETVVVAATEIASSHDSDGTQSGSLT